MSNIVDTVIDDALAAVSVVKPALPLVERYLGHPETFDELSWALGALYETLVEVKASRSNESPEELRARFALKITEEAQKRMRARFAAMAAAEMAAKAMAGGPELPVNRPTDPEGGTP